MNQSVCVHVFFDIKILTDDTVEKKLHHLTVGNNDMVVVML